MIVINISKLPGTALLESIKYFFIQCTFCVRCIIRKKLALYFGDVTIDFKLVGPFKKYEVGKSYSYSIRFKSSLPYFKSYLILTRVTYNKNSLLCYKIYRSLLESWFLTEN